MKPIVIAYQDHEVTKELFLDLIDKQNSSPYVEENTQSISSTDWRTDVGQAREYWTIFTLHVWNDIDNLLKNHIGFNEYLIENYWYQRYETNDHHDWHWHHKAAYSGVYYLELPEGAPGTQIELPVTREILNPAVSEGDIIVFPSIYRHRSAPNQGKNRKTIIAFNVS